MSCADGKMDNCEVSQRKMMVEKKRNLWHKRLKQMARVGLID
jgi:hypothetical protein